MKQLTLIFCLITPLFVFPGAQAWSPLETVRDAASSSDQCIWRTAASEDANSEQKKNAAEQEEEPDCD